MPLKYTNTCEGLESQVGNICLSIVQRSKHAPKGRTGWAGPGQYVMVVQWTDRGDGVGDPIDHPLSLANKKRFGWRWWGCGDGYWNHSGPRSSLGKAYAYAEMVVARESARLEAASLARTRGGAGDPYRMQEVA